MLCPFPSLPSTYWTIGPKIDCYGSRFLPSLLGPFSAPRTLSSFYSYWLLTLTGGTAAAAAVAVEDDVDDDTS